MSIINPPSTFFSSCSSICPCSLRFVPISKGSHHHHHLFSSPIFSPPQEFFAKNCRTWAMHSQFQKLYSSSKESTNEVSEESKFVPLNADDPVYGPSALLLLGFDTEETPKILQLLKDLDGDFLKVIHCTEEMLKLTVWDAMHTQQLNLEAVKVPKSLPRVCILSGLTGEEMIMFIDAFPEAGIGSAVFAALVPNSADKLLEEVVEEIMGDHEMLSSKQSSTS